MSAAVAPPTGLLPGAAYHDPAWFEREQRDLFERSWALVAYESDLGDGRTVVAPIGRERVTVVRDATGEARVTRFDRRPGPEPGGGPAPGSRSCAVACWAGLVFAHLDADGAPPFADWFGESGSPAWVGAFPWDDLVEIGRRRVPLACNWKLYVENHVDIYHLWFLHEESLGMFDHHGLTWSTSGPHWACAERLRPGRERARPTLRPIEPLDAQEAATLRANLVWPNVPLTTTSTTVNTYQVVPTGPTTCELDLRVRAMPGGVFDDALAAQVLAILVGEDGWACEQVQRNVASPWFGIGPIAHRHEQPVALFHRHVLEALS